MSRSGARPVVFGEVLFDCFPDGSRVLGGAPFNVAWHLRGFGEEPLFISRVGNDRAGEQVRSAMNSWKLDTAGLQTDDEHPTGTVQIHLHEGEPHFDIVSDQAYDFLKADALPDLDQPAFLYHGSLAVRGRTSREALDALLKDHAPRIFLDVNLRKPWWSVDEVIGMMDRCTWLKLNADELDELVPGEGNLTARVQDLRHRFGLEQVVVTRGGEGALAVTAGAEKVKVRPQPAVRLVDTVGAGDAFASVLMLGLLRNWTLPETLGRAQDFASSIVGVRGATVVDPGFYQNHLKNWNTHS